MVLAAVATGLVHKYNTQRGLEAARIFKFFAVIADTDFSPNFPKLRDAGIYR